MSIIDSFIANVQLQMYHPRTIRGSRGRGCPFGEKPKKPVGVIPIINFRFYRKRERLDTPAIRMRENDLRKR